MRFTVRFVVDLWDGQSHKIAARQLVLQLLTESLQRLSVCVIRTAGGVKDGVFRRESRQLIDVSIGVIPAKIATIQPNDLGRAQILLQQLGNLALAEVGVPVRVQ